MAEDYKVLVQNPNYHSDGTITVAVTKQGTKEAFTLRCTAEQLCSSTLTPNNSTNQTSTSVPLFKLTDIPTVMRSKGWDKAAYLNEKWLTGSSVVMSNSDKGKWWDSNVALNYYDPSVFNHTWLSNFARYNNAIDFLTNNTITNNTKNLILKYLHRDGAFSDSNFSNTRVNLYSSSNYKEINDGSSFQLLHRDWQIQLSRIDSNLFNKGWTFITEGGIDDLWATFGSFSVYSAIADYSVTALVDNWFQITVESIVCYIVDSYDYITPPDDYLGHWSKDEFDFNIVSKDEINNLNAHRSPQTGEFRELFNPSNLLYPVYNHHYQKYRERYNKGRDMAVWSRPHKINISNMNESYHTFRVNKSYIKDQFGAY